MSTLLLTGVASVQAQKKGDSPLQKVGLEDPYTAQNPKAMAKLGVIGYGPLTWADHKRTTDIEKVLGEGRVLWMETELATAESPPSIPFSRHIKPTRSEPSQ